MRAAALRTLARARAAAARSTPWADPPRNAAARHPDAWGPARSALQSRTARGTAAFAAAAGMTAKTPKIYIMYYSLYGHCHELAKREEAGVAKVEGVESIMYQIPEVLSEEVLQKMHAGPKTDDPVIHPHDLPEADGFLIGYPTRYGSPPAAFSAFWDATGGLWAKGTLHGKAVSLFTSTASQGGGQESTFMSSMSKFIHHGMIYVPPGYGLPALFSNDEARGGSAWGAGTLANGDGSRKPSQVELDFAEYQGEHFAKVVKKLAA